MKRQQLWGKLLKGFIAVSLATAITVPSIVKSSEAVYANTAKGITQFIDIPAGLYAEKHIYRLSLQGIVNGYLDSKNNTYSFKYNNSLSREEAVIMAIRFAGLTDELDQTSIITFADGFNVKADYKPYIDLAFKKGLLDEKEEVALAKEKPEQAWGSAPASREWVTKLIVRTIGQQALATSLANVEPSFYDKAIIDKKYLAYVNAAVQLGLVKGVTETTFQPQTAINRASFSTILSRAQKDFPVEHQNQVDGILLAQTDTTITVFADGKEQSFAIDNNTGFYIANNDFAITKTQLVQYAEVSVISLNGTAKFVEMQSTEQQVKTTEYEVLLVNAADNKITVNVNNAAMELKLSATTKIADSEGKEIKLADIKQRDKIQVLQPTYDANVAPLRVVKVLNGQVGNTITGKLVEITDRIATIEVDGEWITKAVQRNPKVTIPNFGTADLSNLFRGIDEVTVKLNDEDQITEIIVDNRNISSYDYAKLVSINSDERTLTFSKGNLTLATKWNDSTRAFVNGNEVPLTSLENYSNWNNISIDFVSVPYDADPNVLLYQIIRLDLHSNITGKLVSINDSKKVVVIELPVVDGSNKQTTERIELGFDTIIVEHPTDNNLDADDLKLGQTYTIALDTDSLEIDRFLLEEKVSAKVTYIYDDGQIIIQYMGNTTTVNSKNVKIQKKNGNAATVKDVSVNSTIEVVFKGHEINTIILP